MTLTLDQLVEAVGPRSPYSSISITARMRPTGPEGSKVAPPSYPPASNRDTPYVIDRRWIGGEERQVVLLDSQQSQGKSLRASAPRCVRRRPA